MNEDTQTPSAPVDLNQMWFDLALQGHHLVQKQTDALFSASREIAAAQRDAASEAQAAFTKLWNQARKA